MIKLIATNTHSNGVNVFFDKRKNIFYKTATSKSSIATLDREYMGWNWYSKNILKSESVIIARWCRASFQRLDIKYFPGVKVNYRNSFLKNLDYIYRVVDWYIEHWVQYDKSPIHGDLTFDNILFDNDKIYILDWENFLDVDVFWGYDILYFLLSTIMLPQEKFTGIDKVSLEHVAKLLLKLKDVGVPESILEMPLMSIRKIITDIIIAGNPLLPRSKFFPLKYSDLEIDILDESLVRSYRYVVYNRYLNSLSK